MDNFIKVSFLTPQGTEANSTILCSAFFSQNKAIFNRLVKMLQEDREKLPENIKTLLQWAAENPHKCDKTRVKTIRELLEEKKQLTPAEKRVIKRFCGFCSKNKNKPVLLKPFESDGFIYATDSYIAVRTKPDNFSGDFSADPSAPKMGRLFPTDENIFSDFIPACLPESEIVKEFSKTKSKKEKKPFYILKTVEGSAVYTAENLYKLMEITGSRVLYYPAVKSQYAPAFMIGNGFTACILPCNPEQPIPAYTCLYSADSFTGEKIIDFSIMPEAANIITAEREKAAAKKASEETEVEKPSKPLEPAKTAAEATKALACTVIPADTKNTSERPETVKTENSGNVTAPPEKPELEKPAKTAEKEPESLPCITVQTENKTSSEGRESGSKTELTEEAASSRKKRANIVPFHAFTISCVPSTPSPGIASGMVHASRRPPAALYPSIIIDQAKKQSFCLSADCYMFRLRCAVFRPPKNDRSGSIHFCQIHTKKTKG